MGPMGVGIGIIEGGWEFVWAAYGVSAVVLIGYAVSLHLRHGSERSRRPRDREPEVRS